MPDYGSAAYWDERYSKSPGATFDWYQSYQDLRSFLVPHLSVSPNFEVLIAGCGNSTLAADMVGDGYENITNIDISPVVISQMTQMYSGLSTVDFLEADATDLSIVSEPTFDVVIDKALLDSMLCGEDSFDRVNRLLNEGFRILRPGGKYIVISYGIPSSRLRLLQQQVWDVEVQKIPKPPLEEFEGVEAAPDHYMYVCTKSSE